MKPGDDLYQSRSIEKANIEIKKIIKNGSSIRQSLIKDEFKKQRNSKMTNKTLDVLNN